MRRYDLAVLRSLACCALALAAMVSLGGCHGSTPIACAMQCAPPYELNVYFHPGTTPAAAHKLLTSCTDHDPVVIRIGTLRDLGGGDSQAMIYTHAIGKTPRTAGLLNCLDNSGIAIAAWPE
jgi:hypothetical protein